LGGERGRRLGDVDLARVFRVGLGGEQAVGGFDVDGGGVAVEAEVFLGGRVAD
jgi:hypothetical protein